MAQQLSKESLLSQSPIHCCSIVGPFFLWILIYLFFFIIVSSFKIEKKFHHKLFFPHSCLFSPVCLLNSLAYFSLVHFIFAFSHTPLALSSSAPCIPYLLFGSLCLFCFLRFACAVLFYAWCVCLSLSLRVFVCVCQSTTPLQFIIILSTASLIRFYHSPT